jgi:hypothetical protein
VRQEPVRQEPVRQEPVRQEPVRQEPERVADEQEAAADEPEALIQAECPHPADARDYQSGTCAACGAILWD